MRWANVGMMAVAAAMLAGMSGAVQQAGAQTKATPYPTMAPLARYLMPDVKSEIALARSAAPALIADSAEVMVLGRKGYTVAVRGTNGFVCLVERSWVMGTNNPEFWNPRIRSPNCWNAAAARTFVPFDLMKTKLVLAGRSKAQIAQAVASALGTKALPRVERGAMCYMMSKEQYLNDRAKSWYPHVMFYLPGNVTHEWGAGLADTPVGAVNDPEVGVTIFTVLVPTWSDGTVSPAAH